MLYKTDFMTLIMYPELDQRRTFVHDAFYIAKISENLELKIAILIDPYMYIEKRDIELLIFSDDHDMIDLTLRHPVKMHITNTGYRLIKIKEGQLDFKQMTDMHLNDFLLNLVHNKRKNKFAISEVIFSHHRIMDFIERHREFLHPAHVIKLLIMMR